MVLQTSRTNRDITPRLPQIKGVVLFTKRLLNRFVKTVLAIKEQLKIINFKEEMLLLN